ncbi:MAG TPA: thioredoxin domain-containing protein, partial [Promineifilum sp.]|nr:thioredoxin domain-containing protein [Promineifilum sp.]
MTNRLANETSPYLRQHANNPVDWYPWGEEALQRARDEDKPILLSIGYAACHWCHVMAHESFENPATAELMNRYYVNIKVDREERPDLDSIYMSAVQALTGQGGWPMTVFLTPDGRPFYGGTYYPPVPRHGMPAFPQLLVALAEAWADKREEIERSAGEITTHLSQIAMAGGGDEGVLTTDLFDQALNGLLRTYDNKLGGFGHAPKFPPSMTLEFLLRMHVQRGDAMALRMAEHTLEMMARGGIYDQLGGGFARYSTDDRWLVPHFEKMLYDNALLARVYLHAWQLTGKPLYRRVVEETLDFVVREL